MGMFGPRVAFRGSCFERDPKQVVLGDSRWDVGVCFREYLCEAGCIYPPEIGCKRMLETFRVYV